MCSPGVMYSGTVRNWFGPSRAKGYGFVIPDLGGDDVFVHRQHVVNALHLSSGDTVTYESPDEPQEKQAAGCEGHGGGTK